MTRGKRGTIGLLWIAFLLALATGAWAQDTQWQVGTGEWTNGANWTNGVPTSTMEAWINNVYFDGLFWHIADPYLEGTSGVANSLVVGKSNDIQVFLHIRENSSLTVSDDMLVAVDSPNSYVEFIIYENSSLNVGGDLRFGIGGWAHGTNQGELVVTGGLYMGEEAGSYSAIYSTGTASLGSATIGVNGSDAYVEQWRGSVTITGGLTCGVNSGSSGSYDVGETSESGSTAELTVDHVVLGQNAGSNGGFAAWGGGTVNVTNSLIVGQEGSGSAIARYAGSNLNAGSIVMAQQSGSTGSFQVYEQGSLSTGSLVVGAGGQEAHFIQGASWDASFTNVNVEDTLTVGAAPRPGGYVPDPEAEDYYDPYGYLIWVGSLTVHDLMVEHGTFSVLNNSAYIEVAGTAHLGPDAVFMAVPGSTFTMTGANFSVESTNPANMAGLQNLRMVFLGGEGVTDNFEVGFNLGALEIGPHSHVKLVDLYDNALGVTDALYVDSFTLGEGSTLDLNDLLLYVKNGETYDLVNPGDFGGQIVNTHAVTNNSGNYDIFPQVNEDGCILWQGYDGNDYELFFQAPGESVIQLTDNGTADVKPQMNAAAHMVWMNWDGNDWEVWYNLGSSPVQLTDNTFYDVLPQISANDKIYWQSYDGNDYEICRYDPESETTTQLTDNGVADVWPQANQSGHLTWMEWDGNNWQVWYDTGSGPVQLTTTGSNERPQITEDGQIFWQTWDGQDFEICQYNIDTSFTSQITDNTVDDVSPTMHNDVLVWSQWDGYYWQIYRDVLDTSTINQITNDSYNNKYPRVSPSGQIVWQKWDGSDYEVYTYQ